MEEMKTRHESERLKKMRYLHDRGSLPAELENIYQSSEKGYAGERIWDNRMRKQLTSNALIINDLLLEYSGSEFQIDSLALFQKIIYAFEVKNFEGDFYIDVDGEWLAKSNKLIDNPIIQITRAEQRLIPLLKSIGSNLQVKYFVIFVHPEFALFQASKDLPIKLPNQLNRFFREMNNIPSQLHKGHRNIAENLIKLHKPLSNNQKKLEYQIENIAKGICCLKCKSILTYVENIKVVCTICGNKEDLEFAVLRTIREYQILLPTSRITVNSIMEWCGIIGSDKTIRRILLKYFKQVGPGRYTYYIDDVR